MASSGTKARGANPFDSDQEDDALDPANRTDDDDDDDENLVDFSLKPVKKKKNKLKGQAKTVSTLCDKDESGTEVIGEVWFKDVKPSSAVTKRWNIFGDDSSKTAHQETASVSPKSSEDVTRLRGALKRAEEDRWNPLPVAEAAQRLVLRQPVWLEAYRTYDSKVALLVEVDKLHDGDALLRVILFLKQTLRQNTFLSALLGMPSAERHYVSYLRQLKDWKALESFYSMIQRERQKSTVMYQHRSRTSDPNSKLVALRKWEDEFKVVAKYNEDPLLERELSYVREEIDLLDMQIKLEAQDTRLERENYQDFVRFPRRQITNQPLLTTVYYCCLYHYKAPETKPFAPDALCKKYKLTERQFLWMAIGALAKKRDYSAIGELLTVKGWFSKKYKSAIGFDKVAELLRHNRAPEDVVCEYLRKVDDLQQRLKAAKKVDALDVQIEVYKLQKDWNALSQILEKLPHHHPQHRALAPLLETVSARRK